MMSRTLAAFRQVVVCFVIDEPLVVKPAARQRILFGDDVE